MDILGITINNLNLSPIAALMNANLADDGIFRD